MKYEEPIMRILLLNKNQVPITEISLTDTNIPGTDIDKDGL